MRWGLVLAVMIWAVLPWPVLSQDTSDATATITPETAVPEIRIGVLAFRGWSDSDPAWGPLAAYLSDRLNLPTRLIPVTLASAGPLIDNGQLQFLITNPGHFATLEPAHPMSVLATRKQRLSDGSLRSDFGSAIFVSAGSDIASLDDVRGRRVTAVDPRAFGGFQLAWREFAARGIDPFTDFATLEFVGFPQDQIVDAVVAGRSDVGIVRTGLIETLVSEGTLPAGRLRVLNANASFTYPDALSTRLYPEWPFLAMAGTAEDLRDAVALALLETRRADLRAAYGLTDSWGAPRSYHAVAALLHAYADARPPATASGTAAGLDARRIWLALAFLGLAALAFGTALLRRRQRTPRVAPPAPATAAEPPVPLTQREQEILELVGRGMSSKEIARSLGISPKTVEFHRSNLLRKHGVKTAIEMVHKSG
jgi:ABC-type phosphate/phosphonate transport system substrate-binding protein/DNA-binding CsgD family transcriptional regulator